MKKLVVMIMGLMAFAVMASANGGDAEFCIEHPDSPICGYGGYDGIDGKDGEDGAKGDKGDRGEAGADGRDGIDGSDGSDGTNGTNGKDGADGVVDYSRLEELGEYQTKASAGSMAVSAIDFGTTCKGVTEIGAGIGYADSPFDSATAGAVGIKHGFTDVDAGILKAWGTDSDTYAVGVGVTHRF